RLFPDEAQRTADGKLTSWGKAVKRAGELREQLEQFDVEYVMDGGMPGRHAAPAREEAPATTAATETPAETPAAPERVAAEGTPMERATSVAKARRSGKSPADIARNLGIDEDRVADLEKLEKLPPTLQRELHNNYLTRDGETSTRPRSDSGMTEERAITIARRIDDGSISPDAAEAMWKS